MKFYLVDDDGDYIKEITPSEFVGEPLIELPEMPDPLPDGEYCHDYGRDCLMEPNGIGRYGQSYQCSRCGDQSP